MHDRIGFLATLAGSISLAMVGVGAPALAADPPVTLRLGLGDALGTVIVTPFVDDLVQQVGLVSDSITIEPVWRAYGDAPTATYQVAAQRVIDGDLEMGLFPARAMDAGGVTSLQALQAPFLITDDQLATAVAGSDIAQRMLDGMASAGLVGLALYPEDLRHPFTFDACHATPFLSPDGLAGTTIGAFTSQPTFDLLRALGAEPNDTTTGSNDDCGLDGVETGFGHRRYDPVRLTATGNVTFFPRYDVLVIEDAAYARLTGAQQTALRQAVAIAQQHAIDAHQAEADAAAGWCADGGRIVLASDAQVVAFEEAAQSLYAGLEQDPLTRQLIADLRDLKAATPAEPGAAACEHPSVDATAPPATGAVAQLPPDGVYRTVITVDELIAAGATTPLANANAGTITLTLDNGNATADGWINGDPACTLTYSLHGDAVRFVWLTDCGGVMDDVQWTLENDELRVTVLATTPSNGVSGAMYTLSLERAWWERAWKKIE